MKRLLIASTFLTMASISSMAHAGEDQQCNGHNLFGLCIPKHQELCFDPMLWPQNRMYYQGGSCDVEDTNSRSVAPRPAVDDDNGGGTGGDNGGGTDGGGNGDNSEPDGDDDDNGDVSDHGPSEDDNGDDSNDHSNGDNSHDDSNGDNSEDDGKGKGRK